MSQINDRDKEYNHYEEDGWDVWERNQELSSVPSISKPSLSNVDYYKVANFYIKELHLSRLVDKYFIYRETPFLYLYLTGTIVSKTNHKDKLCLEVDDGTGSITCLLDDIMLNKIEKERQRFSNTNTVNKSNETNSVILQASLMNLRATQYLFKSIPREVGLQTGNIIALTGKLTEHNGKKYVFVSNINTASVEEHLNNLHRLYKSDFE